MKLALIPPKSLITAYIGGRDYHMMVPVALEDPEIRRLYRRERGFKILDNGMYEGVMWPNKDLIELALEVKPDEIIMPDTADNFPSTYAAQVEFMQTFFEMWPKEGYSPLLMAVIQGETYHDRTLHAQRLLQGETDFIEHRGIKLSLGFPRKIVTPDDHYARVNLIEWILRTYGKVPMHLLGLPSCWPEEILRAARQFGPYLRGMDTSAPFTWAYANATLNAAVGIERPDNYFMQPEARFNRVVVNTNIDQLQRWCSGTA
jgi:hypothetical protein